MILRIYVFLTSPSLVYLLLLACFLLIVTLLLLMSMLLLAPMLLQVFLLLLALLLLARHGLVLVHAVAGDHALAGVSVVNFPYCCWRPCITMPSVMSMLFQSPCRESLPVPGARDLSGMTQVSGKARTKRTSKGETHESRLNTSNKS